MNGSRRRLACISHQAPAAPPATGLGANGRLAAAALALATLALAALAAPAAGSSLLVTSAAAHVGAFGLEIRIAPGCGSPDVLTVAPPPDTIDGIYEACDTLTAGGVRVVAAGGELRAGTVVALDEGFSVALGAELVAVLDPTLEATFAYALDRSPAAESSYTASFYLRLDDLPLGPGESIEHFRGSSAAGVDQFRLLVAHDATLGRHTVALAARRDDGSWAQTPAGQESALAPGWNRIELDWLAAPGSGHLRVSVGGAAATGLESLDNGSGRLDEIRWGAVGGSLATVAGALQVDEFSSGR